MGRGQAGYHVPLRGRQLAALGWRLLEVPFWEWNPLGHGEGAHTNHVENDSEAQCEYLRERLQRLRDVTDSSRREEPSQGGGDAAKRRRRVRSAVATCTRC